MRGEVVQRIADEGKLPPAADVRIALRRRAVLLVGRKVAALIRLNRRELRFGQETRYDDVAVSAPVSEMLVGDPHEARRRERHRRPAARAHRSRKSVTGEAPRMLIVNRTCMRASSSPSARVQHAYSSSRPFGSLK